MKKIPLTQGCMAVVDDADYDVLIKWKWHLHRRPNTLHAKRSTTKEERDSGAACGIHMHTQIMGGPTDHKDGDGLNNRRDNLRLASKAQNARGARHRAAGYSSKYRGVYWQKQRDKWMASITVDRKKKYLGLFDDEVSAAIAYDVAARKYFGEFSTPNFP